MISRSEIVILILNMPDMGLEYEIKSLEYSEENLRVSLLEVVLGLLQPLHPVFDLQVGVILLKMVPNDFPWPKTWV